jgi:Fur family ferric uptake transcriptional regulator
VSGASLLPYRVDFRIPFRKRQIHPGIYQEQESFSLTGDQMEQVYAQRMTRQRQLILKELMGRCDHPTAEELFTAVRKSLPRISLGTVYRNLDVLVRGGLAVRLDRPGEQARFDADTHPHYHVECERCGRVDDVEADDLSALILPRVRAGGYRVKGVRVEFRGMCPACWEAGADSPLVS